MHRNTLQHCAMIAWFVWSAACGGGANQPQGFSLTPNQEEDPTASVDGDVKDTNQGLQEMIDEQPWLMQQTAYQVVDLMLPQEVLGGVQLQENLGGYGLLYTLANSEGQRALHHREATAWAGPWQLASSPGNIAVEDLGNGVAGEGRVLARGSYTDASLATHLDKGRLYYRVQDNKNSPSRIVSRIAERDGTGQWQLKQIEPAAIVTGSPAGEQGPGVASPQVILVNGFWYMLYVDTSYPVPGAAPGEVAHFVLQSSQPSFPAGDTKRWTPSGFVPVNQESSPVPTWIGQPSTWLYSDMLGMFVVLRAVGTNALELHLLDGQTLRIRQRYNLPFARLGSQHAKLVGRSNGHVANRMICQNLPIDVLLGSEVQSSGQRISRLAQINIPFARDVRCDIPTLQVALHGELVAASGRIPGLLYPTGLLVIHRNNVLNRVRVHRIELSPAMYDSLPVDSHLLPEARSIALTGRPGVFVAIDPLTGKGKSHWPLSCPQLLEDNASILDGGVSSVEYFGLPERSGLHCLN